MPPAFAGVTRAWETSETDVSRKVPPVRVHRLDQPHLPGTLPFLDLLLADDGRFRVVSDLVPDQLVAIISIGEAALEGMVLVLQDAARRITRDASIDGAILAIGHNVDEIRLAHV